MVVHSSYKRGRNVSVLISIFVLGLLLVSGPADALKLSINSFGNSNPTQGDEIRTIAKVKVNSNEKIDLDEPLKLLLDGIVVCTIKLDGSNAICDRNDINISLISSDKENGYGYGYGYDYGYGYNYGYGSNGNYVFKIIVNTTDFTVGDHTFKISLDGKFDAETTIKVNAYQGSFHSQHNRKGNVSLLNGTIVKKDKGNSNNFIDLNSNDTEEGNEFNATYLTSNEAKEEKGFFSGLTGAVIGTLGTGGSIFVFVIITGLVVALIIVVYKRRRYSKAFLINSI